MENITRLLNEKERSCIVYRSLKKGGVLFHEKDRCGCIGIMMSGEVSIVSYLSDGKEIIYNQLRQNEIFGNNLIFSSRPYYRGDILALQDCLIALIFRDDLIDILRNNQGFLLEYLNIQSDFSKTLNDRIKLLSIDGAEERLYYYLHSNGDQIGYVSVSDLARRLYLKRETLSRLLSRLEKQKNIKRKDKQIIFNG